MSLSFEVALPLGALAFWLYDSTLLVHDDAVLFHRAGRRWNAVLGSDWVLFGRRVCLPAPLAPWATVLRAYAAAPRASAAAADDWPSPDFERALRPFRIACTALLALLLVALPLASLAFGSGLVLLAVFATYYALVLAMLAWLFPRRARVGLATRAYWSLAIDVFACAPFAANLVRRLTLGHALSGDALAYAASRLPPADFDALRERLQHRQALGERMIRVAILLVCFVAGYWLVSRFLSTTPRRDDVEPEPVTMSNWYRVLGVRENASADEIRNAYRRAIAQVHPDKLVGAPDADRARAEAKAKQVNAAYELGLRLFEG